MQPIASHLRSSTSPARFERGFSLAELLIAMTLSLVLLGGTLVVFSSGREAYTNIDHLSRIQENGRFALDQIIRDVRSAGYNGCVMQAKTASTLNTPNNLAWRFDLPLSGFEGATLTAWSPALDASLTAYSPTPLNDILVVHLPKLGSIPGRVNSLMADGTTVIPIDAISPAPLSANDVAMISNCQSRVFFQVTGYSVSSGTASISHDAGAATTYSPGNATNDLAASIPATFGDSQNSTTVLPIVTNIYFVAPSSVGTNTSLWRKPSTGPVEEIVEGVQALQVRYGVDTNKDLQVDSYVTAQNVSDWNTVISVQVGLLVYSIEQFGGNVDAKTYTVLDTTAGPYNDRRLRQVFAATTTLRNLTQ